MTEEQRIHVFTWIRVGAPIKNEYAYATLPHKLRLDYERAGNNYHKTGQDLAGQLNKAIERTADDRRTGWKVIPQSLGQGNIHSNTEYNFMIELLAEINPLLPAVRIDMFNCRNLKSSLELAPPKIINRNGKKLVMKEKKSEQLSSRKLPSQSTNFSDAFKYLLCRKSWMKYVKGIRSQSAGDLSTHAG